MLEAGTAVIANNRERKGKHLWTDGGRGEKIKLAELDDEHTEARYIADEIERLATEDGL